MSKTPYELRYDLLAMAQSILTENLMSERTRLERDWGLKREQASILMSEGIKEINLPSFPNVPTIDPDKIIELAETLNKFVSKND